MTQTTVQDIELIVSGKPLPIDAPYPFADQDEGFQWFMKQPTPWLSDMALAQYRAAHARALADPGIAACKELPPSETWTTRQNAAIDRAQVRIAEIEALVERTTEEDLELLNLRVREASYLRPEQYNYAYELVRDIADNAQINYLLQNLVADKAGKLVFNPASDEGQARFARLDETTKAALTRALYYVQDLVEKAKNYSPGQSLG